MRAAFIVCNLKNLNGRVQIVVVGVRHILSEKETNRFMFIVVLVATAVAAVASYWNSEQ